MKRLLIVLLMSCSLTALAKNKNSNPLIPKHKKVYYGFKPYLPQTRNYNLEFGSFWETANMYWLGGQFGFLVNDSCFFNSNCNQYIEVTSGLGGRDGQTHGLLLLGLTQEYYFMQKSGMAPSSSLQIGAMTYSDPDRRYTKGTVAFTQSLTLAAHENLNIKLLARVGYADQKAWSQLLIALGLRLDSLVFYIGDKVKSLGQDALDSGKKLMD